jgi:diphosphate--fructose-6-phosphate 1-phosphotransferase
MPSLNEVKLEGRSTFSKLQLARRAATSLLPSVFKAAPNLAYETHEALGAVADHADIEKAFPKTYGRARISLKAATGAAAPKGGHVPLRVACVLSGGQAPGGHNVIAGIYDYIKKVHVDSVLIGFMDGPAGIYNGQYCVVIDKLMDDYRNSGGFDMIGSGRHKIEKPKEFADAMANCVALDLDGLVVIGGDDSNTNAAVLAEYFEANGCKTKVCGAPKTIDGDLKVDPYIPISFGFDTACRTYSEEIGNLGHDTLGSQKYYHFVRLMGRAASNIALECALQTRPNVCLISEEVEQKKMTLSQITQEVVQVIVDRAAQGKDYGIVLLPEGLIEFIPEFNALINEINDVLASGVETTEAAVTPHLSFNNRAVFAYLPDTIKQQLLLDRDPHGNVQVAKIETEKLLAQTVNSELALLRRAGKYNGSFFPVFHSYGYEGRSGLPSAFDATYCYVLGQTVGAMIALGLNGLISSVTNLNAPVSEWRCGGVPITMMCHMEK